MKKIFEEEYGDRLADEVAKWIRDQTLTDNGCKIYRPSVVVELFDQHGESVGTKKNEN